MSVKQTVPVPSENQLSARADVCLSNGIVKSLIGLSGGLVASVLIFRRRAFPIWIGLGFGAGQGWAECDRLYNPYSVPGYRALQKGERVPPESKDGLPHLPYDSEFLNDAKQAVQSGVDKLKQAAQPALQKAEDAVEKGQQESKSVWDQAKSAFSSAKEQVQDSVKDTKSQVKHELDRFAEGPNARGQQDVSVPGAQEVKDELKRFAEGPNARGEEINLKDGKRWV